MFVCWRLSLDVGSWFVGIGFCSLYFELFWFLDVGVLIWGFMMLEFGCWILDVDVLHLVFWMLEFICSLFLDFLSL